jgi:hypothetical protein
MTCHAFRMRPPRLSARGLAGLLLVLALARPAPAADSALTPPPDTADITGSVRLPGQGQRVVLPASPRPFRTGESLRFTVQYGFIHAGSAWLEVPDVHDWCGHPVYRLVARAESNAFFSRFYRVRNRIESFWDVSGGFSRRYIENRREGKYRQQNDIVFDADRNQAVYSDGSVFPVPPHVQDALSSFYFTRTQPLPLGGSIVFHYHASKKSQPLMVKVLGRERVTTPAGTFDCIAIEPILKAGGVFKSSGRLVVWLTDDSRRMPVLMKSKVVIGSVSVVLAEVKEGV